VKNDKAIEKIEDTIDDLEERLAILKKEARETVSDLSDELPAAVHHYLDQAADSMKDSYASSKKLAKKAATKTTKYAKENPWQAAAIAAGVAAMVATLIRRGRGPKE
jgi:ElaB/YqjD/DUF883 family membrane-anchored ribosome-binding protein